MRNKINLLIVVIAVVLFSCKDKQGYSKINNAPATTENPVHKIVVNEFMDAAGYTYINVTEGNEQYWMAIPSMVVKKDETYFYKSGMVMKDFESKELDRTFDLITFSEGISANESGLTQKAKNPHTNADTNKSVISDVKIEKAKNGISVEELHTKKESFSSKEVIVRGKVVKVNNGILDRNWVHIVDGTQFETKKELTVTTSETVKVGDTVTFKATVILDKDFGQGYVYGVLLEKGTLLK